MMEREEGGERFRLNSDEEVLITSGFRIESFDSIYYTYAGSFLITAREHEEPLDGAINLDLINNSALSILLSALGLEAHINAFGFRHLGPEYFSTIDRLSSANKFCIVSDLVSNTKNWLPNHLVADLKLLFRLRDKLVHFKPLDASITKKGAVRRTFFVADKELGIRCFERTVMKLHELAPSEDVSWIKHLRNTQ
jgi:hypothetical protein